MEFQLFLNDLPDNINIVGDIAIDTEAMGLNNYRDRLCLLQLSDETGKIYLVQFAKGKYDAPNLKKILSDKNRQKILHFARFDVAIIHHYLGILMENIFCTKIASKLVRTYTDSHGLKDLSRDMLGVTISKAQQSTDWGAETLTKDQLAYAASDVLHLHQLRDKLKVLLLRENRMDVAQKCFDYLPYRALLDDMGFSPDLLEH
ncbi:MAG: ribonuclease D [Alphaproteobacteria bacterium 33-17]|nr:MAG: ribonuclease D [Alphaproteobacteria bacterium 33-17]